MNVRVIVSLVALEILVALGFALGTVRDFRMPTTPTERFLEAARAAGCPRDQVENFLRAGMVLQPQQLRFAGAARLCDHPAGPTEIGFGGARMGGKSYTMLGQVGADDCMRFPGLKALLLRKVGTSGRESFEALLPKTIGRLGTYIPTQNVFKFPNGSWIKLGHFQNEKDVDKYLGLEYDVVAIEEATTLSETKKDAIQSCCRSPDGCGWRARTYLSTNPGGVGHAWFKRHFVEPFRRNAEIRTRFIPATVDDNAFATREYRDFLDGLSGWLRLAWRFGDWDAAAGQFFTNFNRDRHVRKILDVPSHWRVWLAMDYGFVHFTMVYLFGEDGDGMLYALAEHGERRWLPDQHADAIRAMLDRRGVHEHRIEAFVAGGDVFSLDRDGKCTADEYAAAGFTLTRANMDRVNGAAELIRRFGNSDITPPISPRIVIDEDCCRLIECIPSLENDEKRPEDVQKVNCDPKGLGGDDPYDACRYGVMYAAAQCGVVVASNPLVDQRWGA